MILFDQVLDEGRIIEFDEPYLLLQDGKGLLLSMVEETGSQEAAKLVAIAKEKYFEVNPLEASCQEEDGGSGDETKEGGNGDISRLHDDSQDQDYNTEESDQKNGSNLADEPIDEGSKDEIKEGSNGDVSHLQDDSHDQDYNIEESDQKCFKLSG